MCDTNEKRQHDAFETPIIGVIRGRRIVDVETLLAGEQEVLIRNGEEIYRLRRTRLGKLILCK